MKKIDLTKLATISLCIGLFSISSSAETKDFCMGAYAKYLKAKVPHKAFATSSGVVPKDGTGPSACSGFWNTSLAIAIKKSLEGCQKQAVLHKENRTCKIVAKQ
jgi:hypothetical protein